MVHEHPVDVRKIFRWIMEVNGRPTEKDFPSEFEMGLGPASV